MAGSNRSLLSIIAVNIRVAAAPTYYPAHSKNGNNVDQRIVIRAVGNIPSKANNGEGETIGLNVVGWGKLADVLARSMSVGKEFSGDLSLNVYKGQVFFKDPAHPELPAVPVYMTTAAGNVPVMVEKTSFRLKKVIFGSDSAKTIADEIALGIRPEDWFKAGTPAAAAWKTQLDLRNAEQYDPSKAKFGQAIVRKIEGPGIGAFDMSKVRTNVNTATAIANALQAQAGAALPAPVAAVALQAGTSVQGQPPVQTPPVALIAGL